MSDIDKFLQLVETSRIRIIEQNLMVDEIIDQTADADGYIHVPVTWLRKVQDILSQQAQVNVISANLVRAIVEALNRDDSDE